MLLSDHSGIAAFFVGSIFEGVLEIYGTTNRLTAVYWYAGTLFTTAGIIILIVCAILNRPYTS